MWREMFVKFDLGKQFFFKGNFKEGWLDLLYTVIYKILKSHSCGGGGIPSGISSRGE